MRGKNAERPDAAMQAVVAIQLRQVQVLGTAHSEYYCNAGAENV